MAAAAIPQTAAAQPCPSIASAAGRRGLPAPALLMALCFAAGVVLAPCSWFNPGPLLLGDLFLMGIAALAGLRAPRLSFPCAALVCLLLGLFCAEVQPRPTATTPLMRIADATPTPTPALRHQGVRLEHAVQGQVIRTGAVRLVESSVPYSDKLRQESSQQLDLRVTSVDEQPLPSAEGLRLTVYAPAGAPSPGIRCGTRMRGPVSIHTEERFLDPGVWDGRAWLRQQGISVLGSTRTDQLALVPGPRVLDLPCALHALQQSASERLLQFASRPAPRWLWPSLRLTSDDANMLSAMLTGDRTHLDHRLRVGFERTGSFHLLVVSGLHLAIFSGLVFWIARRLRLPRTLASLSTILLSLAYALFTGFGQPVQRAFWMITLYLAGRLLWRERHPLNAIGFAALVMLVLHPAALRDAGFQMTLLSVLAVAGIAAPLAEKTFGPFVRAPRELSFVAVDPSLPPAVAQFRLTLRMFAEALRPLTGRFVAWTLLPFSLRRALIGLELLATSVAIELLMALPMALYFHRITAVALPVNILIVPLLAVLLPVALATLLLILVWPAVAVVPAAALAVLLHAVSRLVHLFGAMELSDFRVSTPGAPVIAAVLLLTASALLLIRMRSFGLSAAALALAAASTLIALPRSVAHRAGALEISTIDVGQGDSILLVTPHGKTLLIDAGGLVGAAGPNTTSPDLNSGHFDIGEDVVSPLLWSRGIRRLDAVAITHAHADHIGGMAAVLANFRPRELWIGINPHAPLYDAVLSEASITHTRILRHTAGDLFQFDDVTVRVLAPAPDYHPAHAPGNNDSLVLQIHYGRTTALLEGDAEAPSEERMLAEGSLHADFLKVGHHGSRTSTTPAFLAAVSPQYAAISVGRRNFYGHPRPEVLQQLQQSHVKTFRTDLVGISTFDLDGQSVTAAAWPQP